MAVIVLLIVVAVASATHNEAVKNSERGFLDGAGLVGNVIQWIGAIRDTLNQKDFSLKDEWEVILRWMTMAKDFLGDMITQLATDPTIIQVVQSIPKTGTECFLKWTSANFSEIGPSFDRLLLAFHKTNVLNMEEIAVSVNQNGILNLFLKNNILKLENVQAAMENNGLQKFIFESVFPVFIEGFMVIFASARLCDTTVEIGHWIWAGLGFTVQCEASYLKASFLAIVDGISSEGGLGSKTLLR